VQETRQGLSFDGRGALRAPLTQAAGAGTARLARAHCSRIGFTRWSHENQTQAKFRG
jgi:hypothetical protein